MKNIMRNMVGVNANFELYCLNKTKTNPNMIAHLNLHTTQMMIMILHINLSEMWERESKRKLLTISVMVTCVEHECEKIDHRW